MSRVSLRSFLVSALLWTLFFSAVTWASAYGQSTVPPQEEFLAYRLHRGETLEDIARLFRLPTEELARINSISDPTRLQIDQPLKVPNVFARQMVQLQEERTRLLGEKEQLAQQVREQQGLLAAKEIEFRKVDTEKTALADELASIGQWKRGAQALMALLLGIFAWELFSHKERSRQARAFARLTQENTALTAAKEKYRQAAAHLELRYQKLYSTRSQISEKFVPEGVALIARSFTEGSAQLEHLLAAIQAERVTEEQPASKEQTVIDSLLQPFRGFWQRFKYHGA